MGIAFYSERNLAVTILPTSRPMAKCTGSVDPLTGLLNWRRRHSWSLPEGYYPRKTFDHCRLCGRTRNEARAPKPITLHEALKGN